jgi:hypothetical protein
MRRALLIGLCLAVVPRLAVADAATPTPQSIIQQFAGNLLQGCWACSLLDKISAIGLGVAEQTFTALAGATSTLLGLVLAVWLLFFAARMFLPFGPDRAVGALWNEGAKKLFRFAVVLAFLQSSQPFWEYVFIPLISAGFGLASSIATTADAYEAANGTSETLSGGQQTDYCSQAAGTAAPIDGVSAATTVMTQMDCPLSKIQSQFSKGILVGVAEISGVFSSCSLTGAGSSSSSGSGLGGIVSNAFQATIKAVIGDFERNIVGLALILVYFIGYLVFPLQLIDVIMRVTVVTVISPLAIAATLFHATGNFAQRAVWNLVQSTMTLIFASTVAGLGKATLAYIFSTLQTANGQPINDWQTLINNLENSCTGFPLIGLTDAAFYMLLGAAIILIYMLGRASAMAAGFTHTASGDFTGAQRGVAKIAGAAAHAAGNVAQRVAGVSGSGAGSGSGSGSGSGR